MLRYILYTDGSVYPNPGNGGYGSVLLRSDGTEVGRYTRRYRLTTNNRMEILAALEVIESLTEKSNVMVYSDSQYFVNSLTKWLDGWNARGVLNEKVNGDLWERFNVMNRFHKVDARWVRGHNGDRYNELCDRLANEALRLEEVHEDTGYALEAELRRYLKFKKGY